jgi:hypothetical protein
MKKAKQSKQRTLVPIANPYTNLSLTTLPTRNSPAWFGLKGKSKYHW